MEMGSAVLVATFVLVAAPALALEDGYAKPPATILPPVPFTQKPTPTNTTTISTTAKANSTTPVPTTHHNTTANTTTPKPTTHTTANTTTPKPTTHTTANTTTPKPTTHTTANTTTPPTTTNTTANTTTAQTTTHTTANTTTTQTTTHTTPLPEPTPKTNLTTGNYTLKIDGKLCVMVQAAIQINVNNSKAEGTYIVQPAAVTTDGQCDRATASLNINFQHGSINMKFLKNDTTNMVYVSSLKVSLSYAFKSGVQTNISQVNDSMQLFPVELSHSYSCTSDPIDMGTGVSLEFSHDRMQAFNFTNNQFGLPDLCKADKPDYRVAIAVGIVLIILIVIVVLAYLISRRKRSDGYQSL